MISKKKKTVLIILPKLVNYGGLQIENIGFINALAEKSHINVKVLAIEIDRKFKTMINPKAEFLKLKLPFFWKCFSIWFMKLLIRTRFNIRKSVRIYVESKSYLLGSILLDRTKTDDIIFCSAHPKGIVEYVHFFCSKNNRQFVFHQISEPHSKYTDFYKSLTQKDTILISSDNKYKRINQINSKPKFKEIKQWIYTKENEFLNLKPVLNEFVHFGVICRLDKEKNINLVLKASALIKNNNFKIIIYGEGYELDNLKRSVTKLDITKKVIFKGSIDFNNRYKAYKKIDVFICSSYSEGGPITVLEAMAAGLPVISTNVGDVNNRIINNHNGFILVSKTDHIGLSENMNYYINNINVIKQQGINGRNRYKQLYHSNIVKQIFVNKINECY